MRKATLEIKGKKVSVLIRYATWLRIADVLMLLAVIMMAWCIGAVSGGEIGGNVVGGVLIIALLNAITGGSMKMIGEFLEERDGYVE